MRLPASARERLRLERERAQVVREPAAAQLRVEPLRERVVLREDAGGVAAPLIQKVMTEWVVCDYEV